MCFGMKEGLQGHKLKNVSDKLLPISDIHYFLQHLLSRILLTYAF